MRRNACNNTPFSRPCVIPDAVSYLTSENEDVRAKFAAQAARDWEQILLMRAKELVSGMCLVKETAALK